MFNPTAVRKKSKWISHCGQIAAISSYGYVDVRPWIETKNMIMVKPKQWLKPILYV